MVGNAHSAKIRAALCCGLATLAVLIAFPNPAAASGADPVPRAGVSIINGKGTKTRDWPWQVAIVFADRRNESTSARRRYFCAGSLIARDLVLTAAHCVANLRPSQLKRIQVIAGRTWLSSDAGSSSFVKSRLMPRNRNGRFKYQGSRAAPVWDVALLKLKRRLPAEPVKLAGGRESAALAPGSLVRTTGWGVTKPMNRLGSNILKVATQVVLPDSVCRRDNGRSYQPRTMLCLGGPSGNTSTCFGDSGGPLVSRLSTGWRLIGVTSFGDPFCDPIAPSVDARAAGTAIRGWIRRTAIRVSGTDPVGSDGSAAPRRPWCRVPKLTGRNLPQARRALRLAGCRLGAVRKNRFSYGKSGRISFASLPQGWLTPTGNRIRVWLNP
jgi:secreted trypsin-like serine protease